MTAELTDETNVARGCALLPMTWAIGYVIGLAILLTITGLCSLTFRCLSPFIGGILSRPQDRWPRVFSHAFWTNYPYFLPCLVSACYACVSSVIVAKFLEEVRFLLSKEPIRLT
jgi:hypothetical protein